MSSSTNYNSIINKSLNRARPKPSAYLKKLREHQKSIDSTSKIEVTKVQVKKPNESSVNQSTTNSSSTNSNSVRSVNGLSSSQSFSSQTKRMSTKSSNALQSLLNQNLLNFYTMLSYKFNSENESNEKSLPQFDTFLNFQGELENKCQSSAPKADPIFISIFLIFDLLILFSFSFKYVSYINILSLLIIIVLFILVFYRFIKLKHIEQCPEIKRIIKLLLYVNHSLYLMNRVLIYGVSKTSIYSAHIGFFFINFLFDSPLDQVVLIHVWNYVLGRIVFFYKIKTLTFSLNSLIENYNDFVFILLIEYLTKKARREQWRNFYFFQNSYCNLVHNIMRNLPLPNLVLSTEQDIELYNISGKNFCNSMANISELKQKQEEILHQRLNFQNYIINDKIYVTRFINSLTLNNNQLDKFYYPFFPKTTKNIDLSELSESATEIHTNKIADLEFYQLIVFPCIWGNRQCINLHLVPFRYMKAPVFTQDYLAMIRKSIEFLVEQNNAICLQIKELNMNTLTKRSNVNSSGGYANKSGGHTCNSREIFNDKVKVSKNIMSTKLEPKSLFRNKLNFEKIQRVQIPKRINYTYFDYKMWFYFRYNVRVIYDLNSTLLSFNMNNHYFKDNSYTTVNLENYIANLSRYLYVPAELYNFVINFSVKGEKNVTLNLFYLRIIIFNIFFFIFNNSKDRTTEKNLVFTIETVPKNKDNKSSTQKELSFSEEKHSHLQSESQADKIGTTSDYTIKISINYQDSNVVINYNDLNKILKEERDKKLLISKIVNINFGIIGVSYLIYLLYNNGIVCSSEDMNHTIDMELYAKKPEVNNERPIRKVKSMTSNKTMIFGDENIDTTLKYYKNLLKIVYNKKRGLNSYKLYEIAKQPEKSFKKHKTLSVSDLMNPDKTFRSSKHLKTVKRISIPDLRREFQNNTEKELIRELEKLHDRNNQTILNFSEKKRESVISIPDIKRPSECIIEEEAKKDETIQEKEEEENQNEETKKDEDDEHYEDQLENLDHDIFKVRAINKEIEQYNMLSNTNKVIRKSNMKILAKQNEIVKKVSFKEIQPQLSNMILYLEDVKFVSLQNNSIYYLGKSLSLNNDAMKISIMKGGVDELIERIKQQRALGYLYKAIFIETYRPNDYLSNSYLKENKEKEQKYFMITNEISISKESSSIFDEILSKDKFDSKVDVIVNNFLM